MLTVIMLVLALLFGVGLFALGLHSNNSEVSWWGKGIGGFLIVLAIVGAVSSLPGQYSNARKLPYDLCALKNELNAKVAMLADDEEEYVALVEIAFGGGLAAGARDFQESSTRINAKVSMLSGLIADYTALKQMVEYNASGTNPWLLFTVSSDYENVCIEEVIDFGCTDCQ